MNYDQEISIEVFCSFELNRAASDSSKKITLPMVYSNQNSVRLLYDRSEQIFHHRTLLLSHISKNLFEV